MDEKTFIKNCKLKSYRSKLITAVRNKAAPSFIQELIKEIQMLKVGNVTSEYELNLMLQIEENKKAKGIIY